MKNLIVEIAEARLGQEIWQTKAEITDDLTGPKLKNMPSDKQYNS